jgi:hypothetical protein
VKGNHNTGIECYDHVGTAGHYGVCMCVRTHTEL